MPFFYVIYTHVMIHYFIRKCIIKNFHSIRRVIVFKRSPFLQVPLLLHLHFKISGNAMIWNIIINYCIRSLFKQGLWIYRHCHGAIFSRVCIQKKLVGYSIPSTKEYLLYIEHIDSLFLVATWHWLWENIQPPFEKKIFLLASRKYDLL